MERRVRIDLYDVICHDSEDVASGGDELYVVGGAVYDAGPKPVGTAKAVAPMAMIPGNTSGFYDAVVFDANVPDDGKIKLCLTAWDEDYAKDWAKVQDEWETAEDVLSLISAVGGPTTAWTGVVAKWMKVIDFVASHDKDDNLGQLAQVIPALGPDVEFREWRFRGSSGWNLGLGFSDWDYTLRYRIQRILPALIVTTDPARLFVDSTAMIKVHAVDFTTGATVNGRVVLEGAVGIISVGVIPGWSPTSIPIPRLRRDHKTDTPFQVKAGMTTLAGSVIADGYPPVPFKLPVIGRPITLHQDPAQIKSGASSTITIRADDGSGLLVAGAVLLDGAQIGMTNQAFTHTFAERWTYMPIGGGKTKPVKEPTLLTVRPFDPHFAGAQLALKFG